MKKPYISQGNAIRLSLNDSETIKTHQPKEDRPYTSHTNTIRDIMSGKFKVEENQSQTDEDVKETDEAVEETINMDEGLKNQLTPKLIQLLRMGMIELEDLQLMKRAIKTERKSLENPLLRGMLYELLEILLDAVNDDSQIWLRLRNRIQKGEIK